MNKDDPQNKKPEKMELSPIFRARWKFIIKEKLLLLLRAKGYESRKKATMH